MTGFPLPKRPDRRLFARRLALSACRSGGSEEPVLRGSQGALARWPEPGIGTHRHRSALAPQPVRACGKRRSRSTAGNVTQRRPAPSAFQRIPPRPCVIYCRMTLIISVYVTDGSGKPVEDEALGGSLAAGFQNWRTHVWGSARTQHVRWGGARRVARLRRLAGTSCWRLTYCVGHRGRHHRVLVDRVTRDG